MNLQLQRTSRHRFVHTLHTVSLDYLFACRTWGNWRCYWNTLIEGMWSRYANHVIAVSESARRLAKRYFNLAENKCSVIWNGVTPISGIELNRDDHLQRYNLEGEKLLLLFVGRGEDRVKGTGLIATSLNELYKSYFQIRLLAIPGTGFEKAPWLRRSGPIAHKEMEGCYLAADIFINASLSEGFPLTVVEAMAAGLPVIASPVGGIPEVVRHEKNGLLLSPDRSDLVQQIERLIVNPELGNKLGNNVENSVSHLTWDKLAKQTIEVYKSLF